MNTDDTDQDKEIEAKAWQVGSQNRYDFRCRAAAFRAFVIPSCR